MCKKLDFSIQSTCGRTFSPAVKKCIKSCHDYFLAVPFRQRRFFSVVRLRRLAARQRSHAIPPSAAIPTTATGAHFTRVARFFLTQYTKTGENAPNGRNIFQMATYLIHQSWDFWFENIPSGNTAAMWSL
jgi:hypothetical protein